MVISPLPVQALDYSRMRRICKNLEDAVNQSPSMFIHRLDKHKISMLAENYAGHALIKEIFAILTALIEANMIYGNLPIEDTIEHMLERIQNIPAPPNGNNH